MSFSPELLKQLVVTFQGELDEGAVDLTNGLLELEKCVSDHAGKSELIEKVFRTAHNLKGASRGLGINHVGDITHHIETIFSAFKQSDATIPKSVIDVCLEAVDKMQSAMRSFRNELPLDFDINDLLTRMNQCTQISSTAEDVSVQTVTRDLSMKDASQVKVEASELSGGDSIRVSLKIVDRLSELSEEIQSSKILLDDHAHQAKSLSSLMDEFISTWQDMNTILNQSFDRSDHYNLQKILDRANDDLTAMTTVINKLSHSMSSQANDYSRLSHALHDEVALLRLIPANNYLGMLPRYIRDLSHSLGKNVSLEISGGDVHIDKYVLEGLKDPINHILRNAIDHGIETVEERNRAGKAETGLISIKVVDAGSKVYFEISDDGQGLNHDRIKQKALSLGMEHASKINALSEDELQQFIFESGFSTKNEVSTISGRGVGMDVVKKNVQALKGTVSIKTVAGKGTTFTICVPLSLSSERGLIVRCDDQTFVLPTANIERVHAVEKSDVVSVEGCHAIVLDGHPVLLKPLASVLGFDNGAAILDQFSSVILKVSEKLVALSVDQIIGEREIVIKPIQEPLTNIACVAGATLLDRNKIAIVLNPLELIDLSLQTSSGYLTVESSIAKPAAESIRILVVDDSITTRTLEKNILESRKYLVTTAVNGQEAWDILQKQSFSLMITDVNMPIMDGFELTDRVKQSDKLASMPVIIVTSLGSDAEKARGIEVGADAYIVKNEFESGVLLQTIEQLV